MHMRQSKWRYTGVGIREEYAKNYLSIYVVSGNCWVLCFVLYRLWLCDSSLLSSYIRRPSWWYIWHQQWSASGFF